MLPLFLLYVVVEIAALIAVGSALGVLWTVLLLMAGSAAGLVLVRSQGPKIMDGLRKAGRGERSAGGAVADGMLFAIGAVLMFVPGLVTSAIGLLLLIPPTRWALRPLVLWAAAKWLPTVAAATSRMRPTVIDGEVIDGYVDTASPSAGGTSRFGGTVLEGRVEGPIVDADPVDVSEPTR